MAASTFVKTTTTLGHGGLPGVTAGRYLAELHTLRTHPCVMQRAAAIRRDEWWALHLSRLGASVPMKMNASFTELCASARPLIARLSLGPQHPYKECPSRSSDETVTCEETDCCLRRAFHGQYQSTRPLFPLRVRVDRRQHRNPSVFVPTSTWHPNARPKPS